MVGRRARNSEKSSDPPPHREAVNLFDDVSDVDRCRRRAPLDDGAAMSPEVVWRDFRQKPAPPYGKQLALED